MQVCAFHPVDAAAFRTYVQPALMHVQAHHGVAAERVWVICFPLMPAQTVLIQHHQSRRRCRQHCPVIRDKQTTDKLLLRPGHQRKCLLTFDFRLSTIRHPQSESVGGYPQSPVLILLDIVRIAHLGINMFLCYRLSGFDFNQVSGFAAEEDTSVLGFIYRIDQIAEIYRLTMQMAYAIHITAQVERTVVHHQLLRVAHCRPYITVAHPVHAANLFTIDASSVGYKRCGNIQTMVIDEPEVVLSVCIIRPYIAHLQVAVLVNRLFRTRVVGVERMLQHFLCRFLHLCRQCVERAGACIEEEYAVVNKTEQVIILRQAHAADAVAVNRYAVAQLGFERHEMVAIEAVQSVPGSHPNHSRAVLYGLRQVPMTEAIVVVIEAQGVILRLQSDAESRQ